MSKPVEFDFADHTVVTPIADRFMSSSSGKKPETPTPQDSPDLSSINSFSPSHLRREEPGTADIVVENLLASGNLVQTSTGEYGSPHRYSQKSAISRSCASERSQQCTCNYSDPSSSSYSISGPNETVHGSSDSYPLSVHTNSHPPPDSAYARTSSADLLQRTPMRTSAHASRRQSPLTAANESADDASRSSENYVSLRMPGTQSPNIGSGTPTLAMNTAESVKSKMAAEIPQSYYSFSSFGQTVSSFVKRSKFCTALAFVVICIFFIISLSANIYTFYQWRSGKFNCERYPVQYIETNNDHPGSRISGTDGDSNGIQVRQHYYREDKEIKPLCNNPKLHKVFYGIAYSPENVIYPVCGATQLNVTKDIALLDQLTTHVRLYGTDCNQIEMVLNAIQDLNSSLTLSLGLAIDDNTTTNFRQMSKLESIFRVYPQTLIDSVIVGNEVLFKESLNAKDLIYYIDQVRMRLQALNVTVPVGTSEIGSLWNNTIASHVDIVAANVHPFFGGVLVNESTTWTYDYLLKFVYKSISPFDGILSLSEVGWPTAGGRVEGAVAGEQELQQFLDQWVCANINADIGWYWFELTDQEWKRGIEGNREWESHWGLFTQDRRLKNITIPSCGMFA